ncbi:MAG: hypothetical protein ACRDAX_07870 [Propionibacteriaceae bacterium]
METNVNLEDLLTRLAKLEKEVEDLRGKIPAVDEETILAIVGATCAYMGVKGKVKAIRYASGSPAWAASGRRAVQNRNIA